jgi:hypothetical protein
LATGPGNCGNQGSVGQATDDKFVKLQPMPENDPIERDPGVTRAKVNGEFVRPVIEIHPCHERSLTPNELSLSISQQNTANRSRI